MTTSSVSFFSVSSTASAVASVSPAAVVSAAAPSAFAVSAVLLFALLPHPEITDAAIAAAKSRLTCFFFMLSSMLCKDYNVFLQLFTRPAHLLRRL